MPRTHVPNFSSLNTSTLAAHKTTHTRTRQRPQKVEEQRIKVANILRQFHFPRSGSSSSIKIPTVTDHGNKVTKCGKKAKVNHVVMLPCLNYNEKDSGQKQLAHAHTHIGCVTLFP